MPNPRPWIIAYDATGLHKKPPYTLECRRCFATYSPTIPVAVDIFCAMAEVFEKQHTRCVEKTEKA